MTVIFDHGRASILYWIVASEVGVPSTHLVSLPKHRQLTSDHSTTLRTKTTILVLTWTSSQYKNCPCRYGDFHYKDQMVTIPSYLNNSNSYTGKMVSLFLDGSLYINSLHTEIEMSF